MTYTRKNKGTCTRSTTVTVQDGVILDVSFEDGCDGNLKGITKLCKGMKARDVADMLSGIRCENKETSCPDQLAITIREMLAKQESV